MAEYKITFTPSGAYFFGNEKRFAYDKSSDSPYYIEGEKMPSQSTIMGALRYTLLVEKGFNKLSNPNNVKAVGEQGFNMDSEDVQSFGTIKSISPIFIVKEGENEDEFFVPTPFDHNCAIKEIAPEEDKDKDKADEKKKTIKLYTPLKEYKPLLSSSGQSLYLADYDVKFGLADSFVSINDGHLEEKLFTTDVRVGNGTKSDKDAFFKKAYKCLQKGFSFCVFAEIDNDGLHNTNEIVTLGQGKVPFYVKFNACGENNGYKSQIDKLVTLFEKNKVGVNRVYCISDMLVDDNLYNEMQISIVQTKDYRSFFTKTDGYTRGSSLHRLVRAGSVFVPTNNLSITSTVNQDKQSPKWECGTNEQINAKQIGYNHYLYINEVKGE